MEITDRCRKWHRSKCFSSRKQTRSSS